MVILFESYGNFVSGKATYLALISKKSRGTIILTEKNFSFKTIKDEILFQISVSDIDNFIINKRFNLHTIELMTDKDISFTFYPHKKGDKSLRVSRKLTETLFRELTRAAFKKNYPILYETKTGFWEGSPPEDNWKSNMKEGFIILTENCLSFKPLYESGVHQENVIQIKSINRSLLDSTPFIMINNLGNAHSSYLALKNGSRFTNNDTIKTDKLYEMLNQAKNYKEAEKLQLEQSKKEKIAQIKSMVEVANKINLDLMRNALNMDKKSFSEKIFTWAKLFNFIIDGENIIVNYDSIPQFMDNLATGFNFSEKSYVKVKCSNCGKLIDYYAKICPYCGREN
jgi:hypothetical protein